MPTSWTEGGRTPGTYSVDIDLSDHTGDVDPHPQYLTATDHTGDVDPHGQYLTAAEASELFLGINAKAADSNLLDGLDSTTFGGGGGGTALAGAAISQSGAFAYTTFPGPFFTIPFDVVDLDTGGMTDLVTNPTIITAPAGLYHLKVYIALSGGNGDTLSRFVEVYDGADKCLGYATVVTSMANVTDVFDISLNVSTHVRLTGLTDLHATVGNFDTGTLRYLSGEQYGPRMSLIRISD